MSNIEGFNPLALINGHVSGGDDAQSTRFMGAQGARQRFIAWLTSGPLWPCGCPGKDFVPTGKYNLIDFPQSFYAYVPTPTHSAGALNMANRALVDWPYPNQNDDIWPTGDPLQRALYESLDNYWLEGS